MRTYNLSEDRVPEQVKEILIELEGLGFVAGGMARDVLLGTNEASDIDVFQRDGLLLYSEQYGGYKSLTLDTLNSLGYSLNTVGTNALQLLKVGQNYYVTGIPVHLVKPVDEPDNKSFGTPEEVLNGFDFVACMGAIWYEGGAIKAMSHNYFETHNRVKLLEFHNVRTPTTELRRIVKYANRGFKIPGTEIAKLFRKWEEYTEEQKEELMVTIGEMTY